MAKKVRTPEQKKKRGKLFRVLTAVATGGASEVARLGALAPLLPFKPMMMKHLKKQGVNLTSKKDKQLMNVAKLFFSKVVKPRQVENAEENIAPVAIGAIVSGIVKFIKSIADKKKAGVPMGKNDEALASECVKIDKELTEGVKTLAKEDAAQTIGQKIMSPVGIAIGGGIALIVIFLLYKTFAKK